MAQNGIPIFGLENVAQANRQLANDMKEVIVELSKLKALCNEAETAATAEKLEFIRRCNQK